MVDEAASNAPSNEVDGREVLPLEGLYSGIKGTELPLPPALAAFYGPLRLEIPEGRPLVLANFVETLDGVASLDATGLGGGSAISGGNDEDRAVMGILRAIADVVVVGAGTQRAIPRHIWTAERIFPPFAADYQELRTRLGLPPVPLNVVVTARGEIDPGVPVFRRGVVPTLVVTTPEGAARLEAAVSTWPETTRLVVAAEGERVSARAILDAIHVTWPARIILTEGGPRLLGDFLSENLLDELFLTVAPQVAGRIDDVDRPGLVAGQLFAPAQPRWSRLESVQRAGSHLFLRYRFSTT